MFTYNIRKMLGVEEAGVGYGDSTCLGTSLCCSFSFLLPYVSIIFIFSSSSHFIAHIPGFLPTESGSDLEKPPKTRCLQAAATPWGAFVWGGIRHPFTWAGAAQTQVHGLGSTGQTDFRTSSIYAFLCHEQPTEPYGTTLFRKEESIILFK